MCHTPLSDKGWLRQMRPDVTPEQIYRFTERVGIKLDANNLTPAVQHRARMEAFVEIGFADVD